MAGWWRDVIRESVVLGNHTPVVKLHLRYGMLLFIASEVMFFVAWFWAYFNSAIFHSDVGVGTWPPAGIITLDPWHFPLLNTLILLTSGTTVTWAHHAIQTGDRKGAVQGLILTVLLGMSASPACRPMNMPMRPSPSASTIWRWRPSPMRRMRRWPAGAGNFQAIYGSTFFMATGFHGFHVIIGTIFLTVCLFRAIAGQFTPDPPFRLRGGGLVLALRRRGVAVPLRLHLCLGRGPVVAG